MPIFDKAIDVSKWQGEMNWDIARSRVDEAHLRVGSIDNTTGELYVDYQWFRNINEVQQRDFKRLGGYWYFRPNFNPTNQADYFVNNILSEVVNIDNFELTVDVEATGGKLPAYISNTLETFIDRVKTLTGNWCNIYTRASFWNPYVESRPLFGTLKLWVARYSNNLQHPWSDDPSRFQPKDWNNFWLWQYSADGNWLGAYYGASSYHIDVNYVNEISVPEPPTDGALQFEVQSDTLNVRTGPGTNYPTTGTQLHKGDIITVDDVDGANSWIKHELGWSAKRYNGVNYLTKK